MSKIVDITNKISFQKQPKLKIKDIEITVNDDAPTVIKVMGLVTEGNPTKKEIMEAYKLLFDDKERKKIDAFKLNFEDFSIVLKSAISLVSGVNDEKVGE